jgi:hypothetical protein
MKTFWKIIGIVQGSTKKISTICCINREGENETVKMDIDQIESLFDYYYGNWKSWRYFLSAGLSRGGFDKYIAGKTFPGDGNLEKDLKELLLRIPITQEFDNKEIKVWKFLNFRQILQDKYSVDIECVGSWDMIVTFEVERKEIEKRLCAFFGIKNVEDLDCDAVLEMPWFEENQGQELWLHLDNLMKESGF